jgi:hypothetical protein
MTEQDYRAALDAALKEYETLGREKGAIDDRLAQLGQTIGTLTRLLGLTPTVPLGLTDACRMILRHGEPLTPVAVRDRLVSVGIDMSKYANDLAAVHTILKRLSSSGELRFIAGTPGSHRYVWNRAITPVGPVAPTRDIVSVMHDATHEREAMRVTAVPEDEDDPPRATRTKRPASRKAR